MTDPWTAQDIPDLTGRLAVVTGANSGLGWEVSRYLAAADAEVILACRNSARADAAAAAIRRDVPDARLSVELLDLADLSSIESFAGRLTAKHATLDLLCNNAGLMAVDRSTTADGFETQLGVNHLGPFALTGRLLPLLTAADAARVVTMSSFGHRAGRLRRDDLMQSGRYGRWRAYFQSKLANLLFTAELDRRLRAAGSPVTALAAHPGGSSTDLGTEGGGVTNWAMRRLVPRLTQPAAAGALPMLRAATDDNVHGGEFYGPHRMMSGLPRLETPSARARNADDAAWLWDESARLTGVDYAELTPSTR